MTPLTPSSLSPPPATTSMWRSNVICYKLLWVCYYYCRCLGMVAFRIKQHNHANDRNENNFRESGIRAKPIQDMSMSVTQHSTYDKEVSYRMLWLHIPLRIILCAGFTSGMLQFWLMDDYIFSILVYSHVVTIILCPLIMLIVEVWHRKRLARAMTALFHLLKAIEGLRDSICCEIFQWTHAIVFVLKVLTFICEVIFSMQGILTTNSWTKTALLIVQSIILTVIWLNIHVATLLYVCTEAMFGNLNHYMRNTFSLRLRSMQRFGGIAATSKQENQLTADMAKFIGLYKKVHRLSLELHHLWQMPLACTLLSMYCGMLSIIYYIIWQYFEFRIVCMGYIPYIVKLLIDIMMLSLAAHRAIKSSQLIGCMGLENATMVENIEWHRQIEQFLCYINLNEFKLNLMGLYDITNSVTLTIISGILTSISIFIPFAIKTYRIQMFMEKWN